MASKMILWLSKLWQFEQKHQHCNDWQYGEEQQSAIVVLKDQRTRSAIAWAVIHFGSDDDAFLSTPELSEDLALPVQVQARIRYVTKQPGKTINLHSNIIIARSRPVPKGLLHTVPSR